nr:hypothetical protein [Tanacetum cinerariifolium]
TKVQVCCGGEWWRVVVSSGSGGEGLGKRGEVVAGSGGKRSYGNKQYVFKSWGKGDRVYNW